MVRAELQALLVAVGYLTRIPVPSLGAYRREALDRAVHHFPWVGLLVGALSAGALLGAGRLWPPLLAALVAVSAGVLLTGAFHEDGLADTADGLVGGTSIERRLAIMKDSRLGTYAVLTLVLALGLKVVAVATLAREDLAAGAAALLVAHPAGRLAAIAGIRVLSYVGSAATGKEKPTGTSATWPGLGWGALAVVGVAAVMVPVLGVGPVLAGLGVAAAVAILVGWWARRRIGGYTGDVLGAIEQVTEIGLLVALAAC